MSIKSGLMILFGREIVAITCYDKSLAKIGKFIMTSVSNADLRFRLAAEYRLTINNKKNVC